MNCFITGASGFVGANLVHELVKRGHRVKALVRPGSDVLDQPFPKADPAALVQDEIELVIQVNGKLCLRNEVLWNPKSEVTVLALFSGGKAPRVESLCLRQSRAG